MAVLCLSASGPGSLSQLMRDGFDEDPRVKHERYEREALRLLHTSKDSLLAEVDRERGKGEGGSVVLGTGDDVEVLRAVVEERNEGPHRPLVWGRGTKGIASRPL